MTYQTLRFELNRTETIALAYPDGINVRGRFGPQVRFTLTDNRVMYLDTEAYAALKMLNLQLGELFTITRRREEGQRVWWDIRRVLKGGDATEFSAKTQTGTSVAGAARPSFPQSDARPLEASRTVSPSHSPETAHERPRIAPEAAENRGLRTEPDRKSPQVATTSVEARPVLTRTPPVKPTYEEAFRECVRIVQTVLEETGEQWSDQSRQAMVSTMMIQAGRENSIQFRIAGREKARVA